MDAVRYTSEVEGRRTGWERTLLDRAIYGAWRDCVDEGIGNEATLALKAGAA